MTYRKVKSNKGNFSVDRMDWVAFDRKPKFHLYKLWNRLSSGSYFPPPVRELAVNKKKSGGVRKLGIPTLLDRIAREVVKSYLERIVEPKFHECSLVICGSSLPIVYKL